MKKSRFMHRIDFGDSDFFCIYNALLLKPVFVEKILAERIISSEDLGSFDEVELLEALKEAGIIIDSDEDDDISINNVSAGAPQAGIGVLYLLLTSRCNFTCDYCFLGDSSESYHKHDMDLVTARKVVDFYARAIQRSTNKDQRRAIVFYGGEPLFNRSIFFETVEYVLSLKNEGILPENVILSVVTNGAFLDDEAISFIKEKEVIVNVSLDGNEKATNRHRNINGDPAFPVIISGINRLKERGVPFGISCTLNEETIREGNDQIEYLVNEVKPNHLGYNMVVGGAANLFSENYIEKATDFMLRSTKYFQEHGIYEARIMRRIRAFSKQKPILYDCYACAGDGMAIGPDGSVGVCQSYIGTGKNFVGNVFDEDLEPENTEIFKEWHRRLPIFMPQCQNCVALGICGGGCTYNADFKKGSIWELDDEFCAHMKTVLTWLISSLWLLVKEEDQQT